MESSKISFLLHKNSNAIFNSQGRLAQLVERLPYKQNVGGSIPSAPTISPLSCFFSTFFLSFSFILLHYYYNMRNPYQRHSLGQSHSSLSPKDLYKQFIETMLMQKHVIGLYDEGWALCSTPTGQQAFAMWQSKNLAQLLQKGSWQNYQIQEISLSTLVQKLIPYLREQRTLFSLNLTPEGQNLLVKPENLLADIKRCLYQLYMQKPEAFADLQLALPRSIRLN